MEQTITPWTRTPQNECGVCKNKRNIPGDAHIACANPDLSIKANPHGIRNGWFLYPLNFDPVWKRSLCSNFLIIDSIRKIIQHNSKESKMGNPVYANANVETINEIGIENANENVQGIDQDVNPIESNNSIE